MGCAGCFNRNVDQPHRKSQRREIAFLQEELKNVKPSQLVAGEQFQRHWQRVADYCESAHSRKPIKRAGDEQAVETELRALRDEVVSSKWKLLIFCRGFDFYEKQEDQLNQKLTHECFTQISKDLNRTFPQQPLFQTEQGQLQLQCCLKRLALYFPKVGYTQGVNFIVGYLMLRNYSESDTFWLSVYFALSPQHLLLGLFQDGFPLASIYCRLFKALLRDNRPKLYTHFQQLGVSDEIWIFKWFMTYFLYSFPLVAVEQVWDITVMVGGLGLVYFAMAVVEQLEEEFLTCEDDSDVAIFISGLKEEDTFKHFVKIGKAVTRSYEFHLSKSAIVRELRNLETSRPNVYLQYYLNSEDPQAQKRILDQWYENLKSERIQFRNNQLQAQFSEHASRPMFSYKKKETKFRVKQEQRKQQLVRLDELRKSESVCSHNSSISNRSRVNSRRCSGHGSRLASKPRSRPGSRPISRGSRPGSISESQRISQLASSRQSECLPSDESIVIPQQTDRSQPQPACTEQPGRLNASVFIKNPQIPRFQHSHEQHQVQIFELKGKPISFKKKKNSQNNCSKPSNRTFRKISERDKTIRKAPSISKKPPRQILQSIQNQDRSVVEFEGSSNIVSSISDNKVISGSPESMANNQSMKALQLEDPRCTQSVQIESVH